MEAAQAESSAPNWYKEPCMLGIVLGPMVYGSAYCPIADATKLKQMGFADSKTLTEEKRERLFEAIAAAPRLGGAVDCATAAAISGRMLAADKTSLNQLAMASTCSLIQRALEAGLNLIEVYVDTVGDAGRHRDALAQRFPGISFTVCPKADAIYPIVSAASIVAKVTRDRALRQEAAALAAAEAAGRSGGGTSSGACSRDEEGTAEGLPVQLGSGYPADPMTKAWLEREVDSVFGWPALVRFSWSTCHPILEAKAVLMLWECEAEGSPGQAKLSFGGNGASSGAPRHSYWRARKLQRVMAGAF